jgi:hypothetical protein
MMVSFEKIFQALQDADVQYVVAGGVAMNLHGVDRFTADLDLVIHLEEANVLRCVDVMRALGLRPRLPVPAEDLAQPEQRKTWAEEKHMLVFSFLNPENPMELVDIFIQHPLPFEQLSKNAIPKEAFGATIPVMGVDDLITLKRTAGRPKDLFDIGHLEALVAREADGA